MTPVAPQRISEIVEDCIEDTTALSALLGRLSDADVRLSATDAGPELLTAVRATRNAIAGIKGVVELEVQRRGL